MEAITLPILYLALFLAIMAIQSQKLLTSALFLAGVSIGVSILFYILGCPQVGVIELNVGAGLVTVLFVFSINFIGEESPSNRSIVPTGIALLVLSALAILLILSTKPPVSISQHAQEAQPTFASILWESRNLDVLLQIFIFFAGVMGLLGLLAEAKPPLDGAAAAEISEKRKRDLEALEAHGMATSEEET